MLLDSPDDTGYLHVYQGVEVQLSCRVTPSASTNVTWLHREHVRYYPPVTYDIYVNGHIYRPLLRRFTIDNATAGDYSLTILNIHHTDAGLYRCFNNQQLLENYTIDVDGEYRILI